MILGTFIAGALLRLSDRDEAMTHPDFRPKLTAIGFGVFIPVFFVTSGVRFDLDALFADTSTLIMVPIFLAALLVVRGLPALLYRGYLNRNQVRVAALFQATSLPFIVAATAIGVDLGLVDEAESAALIAAGLLSVMVFPLAALALLRRAGDSAPAANAPADEAGWAGGVGDELAAGDVDRGRRPWIRNIVQLEAPAAGRHGRGARCRVGRGRRQVCGGSGCWRSGRQRPSRWWRHRARRLRSTRCSATALPARRRRTACGSACSTTPRSTQDVRRRPDRRQRRLPGGPPRGSDGPFPLVVIFHGYGGTRSGSPSMRHWLDRGYAAFTMTDRGFRESCGSPAAARRPAAARTATSA